MILKTIITIPKLKIFLPFLLILLSTKLHSQESSVILQKDKADTTYWLSGGNSSLTFSQVSLANWASGGQNSTAINGNFNFFVNYVKNKSKWENSLTLAYGLINQQESSRFNKSDDLINLVTKYNFRLKTTTGKWFFSTLLDFRTQFDEGFGTTEEIELISDFMSPAYLTVGIGISLIPSDKISFYYQPLTGKLTFVLNQSLSENGAFGVTPNKKYRGEFGSFFRIKYKDEILESKLELFTGYTENFGDIDINWQNNLFLNITKIISVNLFSQLIYDKDILIGKDEDNDGIIDIGTKKPRVQFKNVLGVGLGYNFGHKPNK